MVDFLFALWSGASDVVLNIFLGLVTGLLSGLAVARAARFGQIKHQLHRQIRNWYYIASTTSYEVLERVDDCQMSDAAMELAYLGHHAACTVVLSAANQVERHQRTPHPPDCNESTLRDLDAKLQRNFRELRPNWTAILLNGKL